MKMLFNLAQHAEVSKINLELLCPTFPSAKPKQHPNWNTNPPLQCLLTSRRYTKFSALLPSTACRCNKKEIQHAYRQTEAGSPGATTLAEHSSLQIVYQPRERSNQSESKTTQGSIYSDPGCCSLSPLDCPARLPCFFLKPVR